MNISIKILNKLTKIIQTEGFTRSRLLADKILIHNMNDVVAELIELNPENTKKLLIERGLLKYIPTYCKGALMVDESFMYNLSLITRCFIESEDYLFHQFSIPNTDKFINKFILNCMKSFHPDCNNSKYETRNLFDLGSTFEEIGNKINTVESIGFIATNYFSDYVLLKNTLVTVMEKLECDPTDISLGSLDSNTMYSSISYLCKELGITHKEYTEASYLVRGSGLLVYIWDGFYIDPLVESVLESINNHPNSVIVNYSNHSNSMIWKK